MELGWVWLHRKIKDWEWYGDANTMRVFIHLLVSVNHQENKWRGEIVERGSCITSYQHIADSLNLSVQNVRTAINHLKSTDELTYKGTPKYSHITINRFSKYNPTNKLTNNQLTSNQQPTNNQLTTNKNDNNDKNDNKRESALTTKDFSHKKDITDTILKEISDTYEVPVAFVEDCWDSAQNWCDAKGKVQKNYKAFLSNWVKRERADRILKTKNLSNKRGGVYDARTK